LIAVLPQPVEDGRNYLNKLGVSVDEVRQLPLDKIGVQGTPTIILVDDSGVVRNSWIGFLPPDAELSVLKALNGA
jgi:thioredoxin-related protein